MSEGLLYFLLATAVAFVITAVEQKAWNARRWAYAAIAVACLAAIPLWGPIGSAFPKATAFVERIPSPTAWFTLFMVLFIISLRPFQRGRPQNGGGITGGDVQYIVRFETAELQSGLNEAKEEIAAIKAAIASRQDTPVESPRENLAWLTPPEAAKRFFPELTDSIRRGWEDIKVCDSEMEDAQRKMQQISARRAAAPRVSGGVLVPRPPLSPNERRAIEQENARYNLAKDRRGRVHREIDVTIFQRVKELKDTLERGELIANGFTMSRTLGAPPFDIPKHEWRILEFDTTEPDWSAVRSGESRIYYGVRIAKPVTES